MVQTKRVMILEDHPLMLQILSAVCGEAGLTVVHASADAGSFIASLHDEPAVALIDLRLDGRPGEAQTAGVEVLRDLAEHFPRVRPVVLTADARSSTSTRCRELGAWAFLRKAYASADDVVATVRAVGEGEHVAPTHEDPTRAPRPLPDGISAREREVLSYVAAGMDNLKISAHLGITERTVRAHMGSLYKKLGVENRTELALHARDLGIRLPEGDA